ncbi:hypothetical protein F5B20DRAFT_524852 [Whalleya microplaca]|nr:hypothetical protein F5B20DRAFT_524852 [Whalleya microplaca]
MTNSETKSWWRTHIMHPPPVRYSPPICPCVDCYNGFPHNSKVGTNSSIESKRTPTDKHLQKLTIKTPNKVYKQHLGLVQKPRTESIASDFVPLCSAAQSTPRLSSDSLAITTASSKTG